MQAKFCPDECNMYFLIFDFRQNKWSRLKSESPKITEDNQQLHDSIFVFSKFTTRISHL